MPDERHPVAGHFDLAEQVRIQEDTCALLRAAHG